MGIKDFVILADPFIAHEVFITNGNITSSRPYQTFGTNYYSLGGRGIVFSPHGKRWKVARTAAANFLAPKMVNQFTDVLQYEANHLINQLLTSTKKDGNVNPVIDLNVSSLNVVLTVCFGFRTESNKDPIFVAVTDTVNKGMKMAGMEEDMSTYIPALAFLDFFKSKDTKQRQWVSEKRDPIMKKIVEKAISGDKDCLIKGLYDSNEKMQFEDEDFLVLSNDLIAAGSDTISVTLSWAFLYLSQRPDIQKRICSEVDAFILQHNRLPDFSERDNFPYMNSVQKELLRFFPTTAFGVPHVAEQDVRVGDYVIKKDTVILSNVYSMQRNPDIFSDPNKFIPERYMNNTSTLSASANGNVADRDQYVFGWGRRICPGIYLADIEMFILYTRLWSRCTIEPAIDSNGLPMYGDIITPKNNGLVLLPQPYQVKFIERPDKLL
ncbi:cytochrome P450 [Spinellus fusiger]|nr:cytochrome P450 [Spinellus fusiger]